MYTRRATMRAKLRRDSSTGRRRSLRRDVLLGLVVSSVLGCNAIFGVDGLTYDAVPYEGGGGSSSTGGSGGSGATGGGVDEPCSYVADGCRCFRDDDVCGGLPNLEGWDTDVQLYSGAPSASPPCSDPIVSGSLDAGAVGCSPCGCDEPTVVCQVESRLYDNFMCGGVGDNFNFDDTSCVTLPVGTSWQTYDVAFDVSGSCAATGGASIEAAAYASVCGRGLTCDAGCLPVAEAGYDQKLCIARAGTFPCPDGFTESQPIYDEADFCSACECGPAAGINCELGLYFNDAVCQGSRSVISNDMTCVPNGNPPYLSAKTTVEDPGSCEPTGGLPLPRPPAVSHTVCCRSAP